MLGGRGVLEKDCKWIIGICSNRPVSCGSRLVGVGVPAFGHSFLRGGQPQSAKLPICEVTNETQGGASAALALATAGRWMHCLYMEAARMDEAVKEEACLTMVPKAG